MRISRKGTRRERGASAVEYALIAAFVAGAIMVTVTVFGSSVAALFGADWPF